MSIYRLLSNPMVHTPGLVAAAIQTYGSDKEYWLGVFVDGYSCPRDAADALLSGAVPYTIDADKSVVFEHAPEAYPEPDRDMRNYEP